MSDCNTVLLNVGGTKFEVSRTLIQQYPNTMIARLISETWQKNTNDEIFIGRDGRRFRYVLDYMRDHRIHLPLSASKTAVLRDLEYYGFENILIESIDHSSASLEAAAHMASCEAKHREQLNQIDTGIRGLQKERAYVVLAYDCFLTFSRTGSLTSIPFFPPEMEAPEGPFQSKRYKNAQACFSAFDEECFDECLAKYGLYYIRHERRKDCSNERARYGFKVTLGSLSAACC